MGRVACKEPQCLYKGALYLYLLVLLNCLLYIFEGYTYCIIVTLLDCNKQDGSRSMRVLSL